jgi:hypothetical protein
MNGGIKKANNNFIRLITNADISYKIYIYWALLAVLLTGVFGIYPFTREVVKKYQISKQMVQLNKDLSKKISDISDATRKIKLIDSDIRYLDAYLPYDFNIQNYMVDFVIATGEAGYNVNSFTPEGQEGSSVRISVSLSGEGDINQLTKNLEGLNRVSEIENIALSKKATEDSLRLSIVTFTMEKQ